ncbi:MAG: hypothetical protein HQ501_02550 [Rhodospirillales bacterium]|nr:hypothetical protein [Rhodospirillales bacterium]
MLSIIAPLSYERYAVLISPLLVADVLPTTAKPPPRQVEQLSPVNPTSRRSGSHPEEVLKKPISQAVNVPQSSPVQSRTRPLHGPPPPDARNFLSLPVHSVGSMRGQAIADPRKLVRLYEHPEITRAIAMSISA